MHGTRHGGGLYHGLWRPYGAKYWPSAHTAPIEPPQDQSPLPDGALLPQQCCRALLLQSRRVGEPLAQLVAREAAAAHLTRVTSTRVTSTQVTSTRVTSTSTSTSTSTQVTSTSTRVTKAQAPGTLVRFPNPLATGTGS